MAVVASASNDGTVKLWDVASGECRRTVKVDTGRAIACAFSPDGRRIAATHGGFSSPGRLEVWDALDGGCVHSFGLGVDPGACAFSADGRWLAAGDSGHLWIWDAETGECVQSGGTKPVLDVAFSPDGRHLAIGTKYGGTVQLFDLPAETGSSPAPLQPALTAFNWAIGSSGRGINGNAAACVFSPDATRIACVICSDELLSDSRIASGSRYMDGHMLQADDLHEISGGFVRVKTIDRLSDCAFAPDGTRVAFACQDGTVSVCDAETGSVLCTIEAHPGKYGARACGFSPDSSLIVSAGADKTVKVWDAETGRCLTTLHGHTDWVNDCVFSPAPEQAPSKGA